LAPLDCCSAALTAAALSSIITIMYYIRRAVCFWQWNVISLAYFVCRLIDIFKNLYYGDCACIIAIKV
jgi:hypothetical protein